MDVADALPQELVFVDLETTGGNAAYHRVTEVGIVRVLNGELVEEWSSLVNPGCLIPAYIEDFTGITNAMVAAAPRFADISVLLRSKLSGAVFVAHNARFDYSFLRSEFRRMDETFSAKVLCTVKLSRRLFPQFPRHNLDALMERHGLACSARHRALGDARVLHDFWFKLQREIPQAKLQEATNALLVGHNLPAHLPADLADDLPEGPGVYRLFGEAEVLLYVGRSHSLRTRVLAQLGGESPVSRENKLAAQVRRVDWQETAGELGAALREAELIKTQRPVHNRRVKDTAQSCTLRINPLLNGKSASAALATAVSQAAAPPLAAARASAPSSSASICLLSRGPVEAVAINGLDPQDLAQCFGVFHSEKDARKALLDIAGAKQLCLKVLGLEQSTGACFAYQVGKCKGACIGKEPLMLQHMRLGLALSSLKLKAWPFPGRIALRERAAKGFSPAGRRGGDLHVLDQWAYLGTARSEEELAAYGSKDSLTAFDVDVYRILVRYFSANPKIDWHELHVQPICA